MAAIFLILGLFGGYAHWRYDRRSFWFFGPLIFTVTLGLIVYLNFKYGYSESPELGDTVAREVRDRDYFYLWSFSAWSVWVALGFVFLWESVAAVFGTEMVGPARSATEQPTKRSWLFASPLLALVFIPLFVNWKSASRAGQTETRDFAADLLNSVEPYGVLVTVGDNDTFPLWYAQEVEGIRKDVVIANTSLLNTDWFTRQMLRRPVFPYDSLAGPAIYRGHVWKRPTTPVMNMTMAQADAVPLAVELSGPQTVRKPGTDFTAVIDPKNLPHQFLERADIFVLHLIVDNPDRPVYLSATSGNYGGQLGFSNYLLTQGLARKVLPTPPQATKDTVNIPGEGWMDVQRSLALWKEFQAPRALIRRGDWVDRPSVNIPALYVMSGYFLAEGLAHDGDRAEGDSVLRTASEVAGAAHLDQMFGPRLPPPQAQRALPLPESGDKPQAAPVPGAPPGPPTRNPQRQPAKAPASTPPSK